MFKERNGPDEELIVHSGVLVGGFLAHLFLNALNTAYSTVLSLIKEELVLSYTLSGALMSSYFIGYTIGQIPWGLLSDKVGSRRVITLSIVGIALFTVLFGMAADIWQAIVARFLAGLLGAGVFVPGVKLISAWFSPRRRGTALGALSVGGSIGLVITSWIAPIMALSQGWRSSMIIYGALGLASSAAIWKMIKDRDQADASDGARVDLISALRSRSFWILALTQFIRLGSNFAFIGFLIIQPLRHGR
jgi:MFS family permease